MKLCVVISLSALAKEVLKDHDTIFTNHDVCIAVRVATYRGQSIVSSPYGCMAAVVEGMQNITAFITYELWTLAAMK
uniref:Uncharacterized protein n=1 Tax=Chenopodium quinoa TaxID=63459 RepID=A0A803MCT6_CHEQI